MQKYVGISRFCGPENPLWWSVTWDAICCRNPNVRGAACGALSQSVERLLPDHRKVEKLARSGLLQAAAGLLSDKAPAARAHSRKILCAVKVRAFCFPQVSFQDTMYKTVDTT